MFVPYLWLESRVSSHSEIVNAMGINSLHGEELADRVLVEYGLSHAYHWIIDDIALKEVGPL